MPIAAAVWMKSGGTLQVHVFSATLLSSLPYLMDLDAGDRSRIAVLHNQFVRGGKGDSSFLIGPDLVRECTCIKMKDDNRLCLVDSVGAVVRDRFGSQYESACKDTWPQLGTAQDRRYEQKENAPAARLCSTRHTACFGVRRARFPHDLALAARSAFPFPAKRSRVAIDPTRQRAP